MKFEDFVTIQLASLNEKQDTMNERLVRIETLLTGADDSSGLVGQSKESIVRIGKIEKARAMEAGQVKTMLFVWGVLVLLVSALIERTVNGGL